MRLKKNKIKQNSVYNCKIRSENINKDRVDNAEQRISQVEKQVVCNVHNGTFYSKSGHEKID